MALAMATFVNFCLLGILISVSPSFSDDKASSNNSNINITSDRAYMANDTGVTHLTIGLTTSNEAVTTINQPGPDKSNDNQTTGFMMTTITLKANVSGPGLMARSEASKIVEICLLWTISFVALF